MPDPINWQLAWPYFAAALVGGYLLGSIPFGLVLTRLAGLGDIRQIGSGNIGATNVLRTGRKDLAALTLILDALKGAAAALIAGYWGTDYLVLAAAGAFLGHLFPVWLGFNGGKGVATFLGTLFAVDWRVALMTCATWIVAALLTRISSLSALLSALAAPIYMYWLGSLQKTELLAFMTVLIFVRHHQNIRRLLKGEEPRIGKK